MKSLGESFLFTCKKQYLNYTCPVSLLLVLNIINISDPRSTPSSIPPKIHTPTPSSYAYLTKSHIYLTKHKTKADIVKEMRKQINFGDQFQDKQFQDKQSGKSKIIRARLEHPGSPKATVSKNLSSEQ